MSDQEGKLKMFIGVTLATMVKCEMTKEHVFQEQVMTNLWELGIL